LHLALRGFGNLGSVMTAEAQQFAVRTDYPFALISACQRFLSSLLVLEPQAFLGAVRKLTLEAPLAQSPAEGVMAWFALKDTVLRGAECHHEWFHQRLDVSRCVFRPCRLNAPMKFASSNIISAVNDWAIEYVWGFDAVHCWPPAINAAELLRARPQKVYRSDDLAKAVYVSPATLARSFSRIFGVTLARYQALARLRAVVGQLRMTGASVEGILVACGYRSPKDAYRRFRRLTGLTLSDVRRLSDGEYASLIDGALALPRAEWRSDPRRSCARYTSVLMPNGSASSRSRPEQ
jgi:AraC-like DNA-binding protein